MGGVYVILILAAWLWFLSNLSAARTTHQPTPDQVLGALASGPLSDRMLGIRLGYIAVGATSSSSPWERVIFWGDFVARRANRYAFDAVLRELEAHGLIVKVGILWALTPTSPGKGS